MKWWPWRARAKTDNDDEREREDEQRQQQATEAVSSAEQALLEVQSHWPEIEKRAEAMRRIRQENHINELIRRNLRGRHA